MPFKSMPLFTASRALIIHSIFQRTGERNFIKINNYRSTYYFRCSPDPFSESGRVFLFGKNDYGQLGFGHTKVVNKPSCLKYLKPFQSIHVACGKGHTIVSTACCRLFTFGCNSDGQLGLGDLENKTVPQLVSTGLSDEDSIVAVAAGCHHSAFLTGAMSIFDESHNFSFFLDIFWKTNYFMTNFVLIVFTVCTFQEKVNYFYGVVTPKGSVKEKKSKTF